MERTDKLLAMLPQGTAALLHNASNIFYLSAYTGEGIQEFIDFIDSLD